MNKVRVKFKLISEVVGNEDIGLLILVDEAELHQIVIPCDKNEVLQLNMRVQKKKDLSTHLPEVLVQLVKSLTFVQFEVCIIDCIDGHYTALLTNTSTLEQFKIDAFDAILLAYIAKLPIYIETNLMRRQCSYFDPKSSKMSLPINVLSLKMVQKALNEAVIKEDYELASRLRDEINRRKKDKD